jgi:hypothetical protein
MQEKQIRSAQKEQEERVGRGAIATRLCKISEMRQSSLDQVADNLEATDGRSPMVV